ncbi:hypothetical protein [Andreprevotia sp. IGB-42]|uniref:hypothetical protein n=1 Tax=Andreprevotia sp. IGB-42 TaxID=2497473 RepID=UPI0013596EB1|nr:hypothetical protein [Andreprevotia sp. IGB-42]
MPAASASMVKPYLGWQKAASSEGEASRLQFKASYLGSEADAYVDLDATRRYVKRIGFVFAAASDFDCLASSVLAAETLDKTYGKGTATEAATGRKVQWQGQDGFTLSWLEVCSVGGKAYSVVFSKT